MRRRLTWVVLGTVVTVGVVAGVDALRSSDGETSAPTATTTESAGEPTATVETAEPFGRRVRGWIAYSDSEGIWAVDPTPPDGSPSGPIQLSDQAGEPFGWSRDGSQLLIYRLPMEGTRGSGLFLLNADGTETMVLQTTSVFGASLSPDGSQIAYARIPSGIYVVASDGGSPRLIRPGRREGHSDDEDFFRTLVFSPTFSPDGRKIAYFDGMGDWGNGLRVMNADGSHVRVLIESLGEDSFDTHVYRLTWSPDGSRLAFDTAQGIWVVGADGSGLTKVIRRGWKPTWSPDGSRIAYGSSWNNAQFEPLRIADADGSHIQEFTYGGSGSWNPVEPARG